MAIEGVLNGTEYMLLVNGKYLMYANSHNITFTHNTRDITVRETNNWSKSIPSQREFSLDFDGLFGYTYEDGTINTRQAPANPYLFIQLINNGYRNQNRFTLTLINLEMGAIAWSGLGYLTSINIDTPNEDNTSISLSFTGVNAPRQMTVN